MKDPSSRHICGVLGVVLGGDGVEVDFGGEGAFAQHLLFAKNVCWVYVHMRGCVCVCYSLRLFALAHCVCCLKMHAA